MPIELPYGGWTPRTYQRPLWRYLQNGGKRAIGIWHRRAGKDEILLHHTMIAAIERPASYWTCLPLYAQARKALWTAVNPHTGKRRIDEAFPKELRDKTIDDEMFIRFKNGSTWQLVASDRYDSLVGAGVAGVTFSEWALANPSAWGYIRPMLEENNGWAAFITTPRGNNHAKAMYDMAAKNSNWFAQTLSVKETGALSDDQLEETLTEYEAMYGRDFGLAYFEQEYLCSFSGAMVGAIYGGEINRAEREGRICRVEVDPKHPVHTVWDLGKAANNPIWCFQVINGLPRIVDFYRPESSDLEEWVQWLDEKGYRGIDYVPHDILTEEWGTKRTRFETLKLLGRKPHRVAKVSVQDGINAGNRTIRQAVFHNAPDCERSERVALGLEGLRNYRREWDDEMKTFRENPVKDWSEHIGSAWRYLGLAWREEIPASERLQKPKELEYMVTPTGIIQGNASVREAVEAMIRRKRREA